VKTDQAGDTPTSTAPASGGQQQPIGTGAPGKYDLRKLPEQLCPTVDAGQFTTLYETESSKPASTRNLTTTIGIDICTVSRYHTDAKSSASTAGSLTFMAYVFSDVSLATTYQKTALDNAKLNTTVTDLPGLGDEAFAYEQKTSAEAQKTTLTLIVTVRDSNLQWTTTLSASRSDSAGWTDSQKRDLQSKLATATKPSLAKTAAGLTR
jgi:hypothetical protein